VGRRKGVPLGSRLVTARRHWQSLFGVLALVIGVALAVLALAGLTRNRSQAALPGPSGIVARAVLSPRVLLFGDPLTARFDVVVDRRRVTPDLVGLEASFRPFQPVSKTLTRRDRGDLTELDYTITLQCLTISCLPTLERKRTFTFPPAHVVFRQPRQVGSLPIEVPLRPPTVEMASQLSAEAIQAARRRSGLLRVIEGPAPGVGLEEADQLARDDSALLPAVSYRISPALLAAILLVLAGMLTVAAGALVMRQLRPGGPAPAPEPASPPVSPLAHALGQLDLALADGQVDQQRKALELLARELRHSGEAALARDARQLAWGEDSLARDEARSLAQIVRATVDGRDDDQPA
jgi:hypothetical protein